MKHVQEEQMTTAAEPDRSMEGILPKAAQPALWQLNLLRVGYLVVGVGLAVVKWPLLVNHGPWELKDGTVEAMLVAMSLLALLGLRFPLRMLPVLLFEVAWKLMWLSFVALPLWWDDKLNGDTREQAVKVLWVVIVIAAIPWRHVLAQYVSAPGDQWRRGARNPGMTS